MEKIKTLARTYKVRSDVEAAAVALLKHLKVVCKTATLSDIDYSVCTKEDTATLAGMLRRLGYKPFHPELTVEPSLHSALFMSVSGKYPIMLREVRDGWGCKISLLGIIVPDLTIARKLDNSAMLSVKPVKDTVLGLCAICNCEFDAAFDALEALGFVDDKSIMRCVASGLEARLNDHQTVIYDTPWR